MVNDAFIGEVVYDKKFKVCITTNKTPKKKDLSIQIGSFLDECRIGFDLGASDYKLSAVIDGEPVFPTEIPWNPSIQTDPSYHYKRISEGIKLAAEHLPRVDAIGGIAAE